MNLDFSNSVRAFVEPSVRDTSKTALRPLAKAS